METRNEENEFSNREQKFKETLLELGLLTEITPPLAAEAMSRDRQFAAVVGNPVSDLVIRERR